VYAITESWRKKKWEIKNRKIFKLIREVCTMLCLFFFNIKNLKKKAQKFPISNTAFASILIPILLIKF